jgi:hypothetical protein
MPTKRLVLLLCAAAIGAGCGGSKTRAAPQTTAAPIVSTSATNVAPTTGATPATTTLTAPTTAKAAAATTATAVAPPTIFTAEVWADNWFSLYVNGALVGEDSVPITTEKSFNAEVITFTATYPFTIAMVTKDYTANDTGLEYIGTSRQQMGDGGFVAQIKEKETGKVVAVTNATWRGLVIHQAPTNKDCAKSPTPEATCRSVIGTEPTGWTAVGFDDTAWAKATIFTAAEVGPKVGYTTIKWDPSASFIWSSDLLADNTILWRTTVAAV